MMSLNEKRTNEFIKKNLNFKIDFQEEEKVCDSHCPWTEFSLFGGNQGVEMGCLPSHWDMVDKALNEGKIFSCHKNLKKPCTGVSKFLTRNKIDISKLELIENE